MLLVGGAHSAHQGRKIAHIYRTSTGNRKDRYPQMKETECTDFPFSQSERQLKLGGGLEKRYGGRGGGGAFRWGGNGG